MSAITAIFNLNKKPVEPSEVQVTLDCLKHRGDDNQGIWIEGNIGLGHRMRWVTPESLREELPMKSALSPMVITCDARIDNRDELIPQLSFSNRQPGEITDSEIILRAYEKWDEDCLSRLIGDFVFAIWNPKTKTLFCGRDPLGVKHFYYYHKPGELFVLASEIKAILALEQVPRELNETLIGDLLILHSGEKVETFYKNIKRLPVTHALKVTEDSFKIWQYWQPNFKAELKLKSDKDYEEAFREVFTEAVKCRLRSIHPVGASLSGGLDSSSIVGVASKILKEQGKSPLDTFSIVFPSVAKVDPRIDERRFMQSVIDLTGCNPHFIKADEFSPMVDIEKWFWHADHPIGTGNLYMSWSVCKAAQQNGVKVLLTGTDGDTTISHGYEDFLDFAKRGRWWRMYNEAKALKQNLPQSAHGLKKSLWHRGFKFLIEDLKFKTRRTFGKKKGIIKKKNYTPKLLTRLPINREFYKQVDLESRYWELSEQNYSWDANRIENHWNSITCGTYAFILETFEKCSAAHGIEERHPFFDRRVVEFCISVPPGQKMNNGWTRSILRRSMNGIIPVDVQWRKDKANLSTNFRLGALKYEHERMKDVIYNYTHLLEKYFDMKALTESFVKYENDPMVGGHIDMMMVIAVQLSGWLQQNNFFPQAKSIQKTASQSLSDLTLSNNSISN